MGRAGIGDGQGGSSGVVLSAAVAHSLLVTAAVADIVLVRAGIVLLCAGKSKDPVNHGIFASAPLGRAGLGHH